MPGDHPFMCLANLCVSFSVSVFVFTENGTLFGFNAVVFFSSCLLELFIYYGDYVCEFL